MPENPDFGTFGRYQEIPTDQMSAEQKEAYDAALKARGGLPGPQKILLQNTALSRLIAPLGTYFQKESSLSKAETEIATNLVNAHWLAAYSSYVHEKAGEKAGLPPEKVQALVAGMPTSFDDSRQQVIYEVARALLAPRVVPTGLYRRAVNLLGDRGLTDLTVLLGYFTSISLTLRAYDVPSDAVGLNR